jgi:hypothetical protein
MEYFGTESELYCHFFPSGQGFWVYERKFGSRAFAEKLREPDGNPLVWVQQTILQANHFGRESKVTILWQTAVRAHGSRDRQQEISRKEKILLGDQTSPTGTQIDSMS